MSTRPQKITLAEMRASEVRGVLIYCADYRCSYHVATAKTLNLAIPPNLLSRS
jgi:hypothetical protein